MIAVRLVARQLEQAFNSLPEFVSAHVVGITAERGVAPTGIDGILLRVTQAAQSFQVYVLDAELSGEPLPAIRR